MSFKFSKHSLDQINRRNLESSVIEIVINEPDKIVKADDCTNIHQKIVHEKGKDYLYRVFLNTCKTPHLIITAYKTSKIDKYENKI